MKGPVYIIFPLGEQLPLTFLVILGCQPSMGQCKSYFTHLKHLPALQTSEFEHIMHSRRLPILDIKIIN